MSKKTLKRKKAQIHLEPDGFSIHTFELSTELNQSEWNKCKDRLYTDQKKLNEVCIYSDKSCKGLHFCTRYADAGIRIYLQHTSGRKGSHRYYVRMIVNPRRLIYPQSSKTDTPLDLLRILIQESKPRICELVKKCYPGQPYLSYGDGLAAIDNRKQFPQPVKEAMRTLLTEMRRKQTVDKAF